MTRVIRVAAIGLVLSACAAQPPPVIVPTRSVAAMPATRHTVVPFQAVAPAGYCLSNESDVAGAEFMRSIIRKLGPDGVLLGVFRPCHEPSSPSPGTPIDRLGLVAQGVPPTLAAEPAMRDRRIYLTMMADAKVWALIGEQPLILAASRAEASVRTDPKQLEYLGADDYGAYSGIAVMPANPNTRPGGSAQAVFGMSLTGNHILMAFGASVGLGTTEPHDRHKVQELVSELLRGTIIAAERPARATRPASPGAT